MTTDNQYKDFFNVTDYLSTEDLEISYKKIIIIEKNLLEETQDENLCSFEKISASKMLGIFAYLKYKLREKKTEHQKLKDMILTHPKESLLEKEKELQETIIWFEKNISFLHQKTSNISYSNTFITPNEAFFYKRFEKIKYESDKVVGRLYSHTSINVLSREIRYYLFKDDYEDFDIVNAHPAILLEFSKEHSLKLNGSLENYIKNRSLVFDQVREEAKKNETDLPNSEIKDEILKLLNKVWKGKTKKTNTFKTLDEDFTLIREYLWGLYESKKLPDEFTHALSSSVEKKKKEGKDSPERRKAILQSFFCQTQESVHVIRLVKFLREKYLESLKEEGKEKFSNYYPITDKKVDLPSKYTLSVIPFFDGVYVSSPNKCFNLKLSSFVDEFNKITNSSIIFKKKEIVQETKRLENVQEIKNFFIIHRWFARESSRHSISCLLYSMYMKQFYLDRVRLIDKQEKKLSDEETKKEASKQWDSDYKILIQDFHIKIFDELLLHNFVSEHEINKHISSLQK